MQSIIRKTFVLMIAAIVITAGFGLTLEPASAVTGPTSITIKAESGTGYAAVVDFNGKVKVYVSSVYPSYRSKSVTWSLYSGSTYGTIVSKTSTYCYIQGNSYNKAGTITIKARSNYYPYATKYIKIYVKQLYPTGVTLNQPTLNMWAGTSSTVTATVVKKPWVYSSGVAWTSNNTGVATVGATGIVNALNSGIATVTATSKDLSTLKANCVINGYNATIASSSRIPVNFGATTTNPVTVTGPGTIPAYTKTYTSSNTSAVSVNSLGTITGVTDGSATITVAVNMQTISSINKTKLLTYNVNVRRPQGVGGATYYFKTSTARFEVINTSEGFSYTSSGTNSLLFTKTMLDDLYGIGSLGIDLYNPLEVYEKFPNASINWNAGGFSFVKSGSNIEVMGRQNNLPFYADYYYCNTNTAQSLNIIANGSSFTGYDLKLFHSPTNPSAGYYYLGLRNNNTIKIAYGNSVMEIVRIASNVVAIYADTNKDGVVDSNIMTITRTLNGYFYVTISNQTYLQSNGISFYTYSSYL